MTSFIGNNIRPKGIGLIPPSKVIDGGYRTIIGNGSGLFSQPFTTEWTVAGDAAARTITLPLVSGYSYNCVADWGDGTTPSLITAYNDANRIHTYASDGTYVVKIYGVMEGWSFNDGGDKLKITKVIHFGRSPTFEGFKYLAGCFYGCANLTSLGVGSIPISGTGPTDLSYFCRYCSSLTGPIPPKLLSNTINVTDISYFFFNCSALTGSIPSGFFDTLTLVTSIKSFFYGCSGLTGLIPSGLLDSMAVTLQDISYFLFNCSGLTGSIPSGLLDNMASVTNARYFFRNCSGLSNYGANLCRDLTSCINFTYFMYGCTKMQQRIDTFYASGEESTRFLNQSPDFTSCFERDSFTGTQGTAPDLWNCSFGTGTPTTTSCWAGAGNSSASLTNYASIPAGWK